MTRETSGGKIGPAVNRTPPEVQQAALGGRTNPRLPHLPAVQRSLGQKFQPSPVPRTNNWFSHAPDVRQAESGSEVLDKEQPGCREAGVEGDIEAAVAVEEARGRPIVALAPHDKHGHYGAVIARVSDLSRGM